MKALLEKARQAKKAVSRLTSEEKDKGLLAMAQALEDHSTEILEANAMDLQSAK